MKFRGTDHIFASIRGRMRNSLTKEGAKLRQTEKFTTQGCISNFDIIIVAGGIGEFGIITEH